MAMLWLHNLGRAWEQRVKTSRVLQFVSFVCGYALVGVILYPIVASIFDLAFAAIGIPPMLTVPWLALDGLIIGAFFGLICFVFYVIEGDERVPA